MAYNAQVIARGTVMLETQQQNFEALKLEDMMVKTTFSKP